VDFAGSALTALGHRKPIDVLAGGGYEELSRLVAALESPTFNYRRSMSTSSITASILRNAWDARTRRCWAARHPRSHTRWASMKADVERVGGASSDQIVVNVTGAPTAVSPASLRASRQNV